MKIFIKVLLIILAVGIVIAVVGAIGIATNPEKYPGVFQSAEIKQVQENNAVTQLTVDVSSQKVIFLASDDGKLRIEYPEVAGHKAQYAFEGEKATFSYSHRFTVASMFSWVQRIPPIIIYLPSTVNALSLSLGSGEAQMNMTATFDSLELTVTSGEIDVANVTATTFTLKVGSGEVEMDNVNAANCTANVVSGKFSTDNCTLKTLSLTLSSGDVDCDSLTSDNVTCQITSGEADLDLVGNIKDYSIRGSATSGKMTLRENEKVLLSRSKEIYYGDGEKSVKITITSGSATVNIGTHNEWDD